MWGEREGYVFSALCVNVYKQYLQRSSLVPLNVDVMFPQHILWTVLSPRLNYLPLSSKIIDHIYEGLFLGSEFYSTER